MYKNELKFVSPTARKDNTMLKIRPELLDEWDFEKNNELGLDVYKVTKGSKKKAWWLCPKCKSSYNRPIQVRTRGQNCPYCRGYKVNHTNSLSSINPELAKDWHPTKNGDLTPHDVTCGNDRKAWWLGDCRHEWESSIYNRNSGKGCPYCSNRTTLKGFNDMWTTNPELAKLLANPNDGYNFTENSNECIDWKCPDCGEIIKNRQINSINKTKLVCHKCSDNFSQPEKIMLSILRHLNIFFRHDINFSWSDKRRYDFYIPSHKMIIEVHGEQHYNGRFVSLGGRSLLEEQENDRLKERLAKENDINHYVVIDARESDFEFIKSNVMKSELSIYFSLKTLDWKSIQLESAKSILIEVCDIYQNNHLTSTDIAKRLNLSVDTVISYLKQGYSIGLCDYYPNNIKNKDLAINKRSKSIIKLNKEGSFIKEYKSIKDAGISLGKKINNHSSISACCKGKAKTAYGYRWMYKSDYEELLTNNLEVPKITKNYYRSREVVRLDPKSNDIRYYKTITDAAKENNLKTDSDITFISNCCRGKREDATGVKWMYLEDYIKLTNNN